MRNSVFIKIQPVLLLEQIEQSDSKSEPHFEVCPNSLAQMFQFAHLREQREAVSINIRSFHSPRRQIFKFSGCSILRRKLVSASTIILSATA
jgi:hypothetical protein